MAKTLYRLFGIGKLPPALIAELGDDGVLFSDEGIRGTVTYKNFRGGGRISNWKRQWFTAAIVLTRQRLVAYRLRERVIDIGLTDPRLAQMEFSVADPNTLAVCFEANLFQPAWRGRIEYRFNTPAARGFYKNLQKSGNLEKV